MKAFTIEQIRKYIESQDSLGGVLYNLSEASIDKANEVQPTLEDLRSLKDCEYFQHGTCDCTDKCMYKKNNLCTNCGNNPAKELHTCSYRSDVNNDDTTLCDCCEDCEYDCCQDI